VTVLITAWPVVIMRAVDRHHGARVSLESWKPTIYLACKVRSRSVASRPDDELGDVNRQISA